MAGVGSCPRHGCPLCHVHPLSAGFCLDCQLLALAIVTHEGPAEDPWCGSHGIPTPESRRSCTLCDVAVRGAKRKGWAFPGTGHDEHGWCVHCAVCGLCKGSGRVCRACWRCPDHPIGPEDPDLPDCLQFRWSPVLREERGYFEHDYWAPAAGRWAA